jgi:hypothetical protein
MGIFAVAMLAHGTASYGICTRIIGFDILLIEAGDLKEAEEKGIQATLEKFPRQAAEGWEDHLVRVIEVPADMIKRAYKAQE